MFNDALFITNFIALQIQQRPETIVGSYQQTSWGDSPQLPQVDRLNSYNPSYISWSGAGVQHLQAPQDRRPQSSYQLKH